VTPILILLLHKLAPHLLIFPPAQNWKFEKNDRDEREKWPEYMEAYQDMLNATSTDFAPWYSIPAGELRSGRPDVVEG
jgi:polyphosphate kinase 2 (PPK2 family)